jgi:hypothetical protein
MRECWAAMALAGWLASGCSNVWAPVVEPDDDAGNDGGPGEDAGSDAAPPASDEERHAALMAALDGLSACYPDLGRALAALPEVADGALTEAELEAGLVIADFFRCPGDPDRDRAAALLVPAQADGLLVLPAGRTITVDGADDDWAGIGVSVEDETGESGLLPAIDLTAARLATDGQTIFGLYAYAGPVSLTETSAFVDLEISGGPAIDVFLGVWLDGGAGGGMAYTYEDYDAPTEVSWIDGARSASSGDTVEFAVPLAGLVGEPRGDQIVVTAMTWGLVSNAMDTALPVHGVLAPVDRALPLLFHLAVDTDVSGAPWRAVIAAIANAPWAVHGDDEVRAALRGDLRDMVLFAADVSALRATLGWGGLDELEPWDLLPLFWRGGGTPHWGTLALTSATRPISLTSYRFNALQVSTLTELRDLAMTEGLAGATPSETAALVDAWIWTQLRYRTAQEAMEEMCQMDSLDDETCEAWRAEIAAGDDIVGQVDGEDIYYWNAPSLPLQLELRRSTGYFVGDCGTHTTITCAILKSLGIPDTSVQYEWFGSAAEAPTHNFPIYLDQDRRFRAAQRLSDYGSWFDSFRDLRPNTYVYLPPGDPLTYLDSWYTHDSFRATYIRPLDVSYGELDELLTGGISSDEVTGWVLQSP